MAGNQPEALAEKDKYKHDTQLAFDKWEAELKAATEEMKVVGGSVAEQELELTRASVHGDDHMDKGSDHAA